MIELFELIFWFAVMFIVGYCFKNFIYPHNLGPFNPILNALRFLGVIIHELSHYLMCLIAGVSAHKIQIHLTKSGTINPHGSIKIKKPEEVSFLQALLISLAPLFICTWLFLQSLKFILNNNSIFFWKVIASIFCISLLLGATPSLPDIKQISAAFHRNKYYSIYQISLLIISSFASFYIIILYYLNSIISLDIIFLFYIILIYVGLKYIIRFIGLIKNILTGNSILNLNFKVFNKKRLKPKSFYKTGLKRAKW
ncbi:MAG: M50 family metallopeptidase [Promethearchaeota archaeon]